MMRTITVTCFVFVALALGARPVHAQARDGLVNGAAVGAAIGAGIGVAFTHAVRDSDLSFGQYSRSALIFGAMGAGIGLGVDALLHRRVVISPTLSRRVAGVGVLWRW
jgi:hypothetical protein